MKRDPNLARFEMQAGDFFIVTKKYDKNQPRNPPGSKGGGRWVSGGGGKEYWTGEGTGRIVEGRKFTSDEGYQWHEQGPGRKWAMAMTVEDHRALGSYVGFGYRQVNELRRGIQPTTDEKIRRLTPEEHKAIDAAESGVEVRAMVPPEGPGYHYHWAYEHARDTPSGPDKLLAHWAVVGPKVDEKRLADLTKQADQLDDMIANRGLVLDEDTVVERGAYLPGVSVEDLQALEQNPDDHLWEEKGFTSTFLGDAEGRAKGYPALGKWESIMARFGSRTGVLEAHQDEVGTAVRFYITLPKGMKVASAEAARRIRQDFPKKPIDQPVPPDVDPKYWVESDFSKTPTPDTRDLDDKSHRSESEVLLGSGARFRVTRVQKGYTTTGDGSLKPVEVYEVHMEYVGGGSSEGD